jgi:hypothetical protein
VLFFPHVVDEGSPPLVCQVIEKRASEVEPYDDVKDRVRSWYTKGAALKQAEAFAEKLRAAAAEKGLAAAVEEMGTRLQDLLHGREGAGELLSVKHTGFFTRGVRSIPGLAGGGAAVAAKAFSLKDDAVGLVTAEAPDYKCYVLQVTESEGASAEEFANDNPMMRAFYVGDKQQRVMTEWLGGLLAEAKPDMRSAFWKEPTRPEE